MSSICSFVLYVYLSYSVYMQATVPVCTYMSINWHSTFYDKLVTLLKYFCECLNSVKVYRMELILQ